MRPVGPSNIIFTGHTRRSRRVPLRPKTVYIEHGANQNQVSCMAPQTGLAVVEPVYPPDTKPLRCPTHAETRQRRGSIEKLKPVPPTELVSQFRGHLSCPRTIQPKPDTRNEHPQKQQSFHPFSPLPGNDGAARQSPGLREPRLRIAPQIAIACQNDLYFYSTFVPITLPPFFIP